MRRPARSLALAAVVILAALGFLIYQGITNNLVYYITPSELLARGNVQGESLRLGGQVRPGSVRYDSRTQTLRFVLQDPKARIAVVSHGLPPSTFQPGMGAVVEGTYHGGRFAATNLMVKHCSTYRAPKPGATPPPDNCISSASP